MKVLLFLIAFILAITSAAEVAADARLVGGAGSRTGTTGSTEIAFSDSWSDGSFTVQNSNSEVKANGVGALWASVSGTSTAWCSGGSAFVYVIRTDGVTPTIVAQQAITSGSPDFKLFFFDEANVDSVYQVAAGIISSVSCTTTLNSVAATFLQPLNI